jgi:hypothetical protein
MTDIHPKFIEAIERIETSLQLPKMDKENAIRFTDLLWSDCLKYIKAADNNEKGLIYVLQALEDYRTHAQYKLLPKIGNLVPLIEKRIFPDPDSAFNECCKNSNIDKPEWSHDIVRESFRGFGKMGFNDASQKNRDRFSNRYSDIIGQWLNGRRFSFEQPALPDSSSSDMNVVLNWCRSHGLDLNSHGYLLWYITKKGSVAVNARKRAIEIMSKQEWWHEHIKIHGEEPKLPIVINELS